jgi:hypothetical protein
LHLRHFLLALSHRHEAVDAAGKVRQIEPWRRPLPWQDPGSLKLSHSILAPMSLSATPLVTSLAVQTTLGIATTFHKFSIGALGPASQRLTAGTRKKWRGGAGPPTRGRIGAIRFLENCLIKSGQTPININAYLNGLHMGRATARLWRKTVGCRNISTPVASEGAASAWQRGPSQPMGPSEPVPPLVCLW